MKIVVCYPEKENMTEFSKTLAQLHADTVINIIKSRNDIKYEDKKKLIERIISEAKDST